jgi:hypothetical protein
VQASFALFQSEQLTRARSAVDLLTTLGIWLPIAAIVLLGVGVVVAKDHRRALVGAAAFPSGQSATAVRTRQRLTAAIGWLGAGAEDAGWRTGPVGTWVYANKQLLRIGAVTLAALALVFWGQPTAKTILVLAGLLLVALALIEFLGQPPQPTIAAPPTPP